MVSVSETHYRWLIKESYQKKQYLTAMKRAFLGTDEDFLADPAHASETSGCVAIAALLTNGGKIYVANAGDSRSVLSAKGEVKPLSFDHKPSNEIEKARITGAGGSVRSGRVNGRLALSRALGDFEFKKNTSLIPEDQIITANPDVLVHDTSEEDEFLVLASDGIWDCMSSQVVVDFIRRKIYEGKELVEIGNLMCDHCLAPSGTSLSSVGCDNMTVLIVAILNGRTKEEWYSWIHDRVEKNYGYATPSEPPEIPRAWKKQPSGDPFDYTDIDPVDGPTQAQLLQALTDILVMDDEDIAVMATGKNPLIVALEK